MDTRTAGLINGPITILNMLANVFFGYCMMFPFSGERIKQPLKLLLGSMVFSILTYHVSATVVYFSGGNLELLFPIGGLYMYSIYTCMSICVWLSFFYYTQLVPAQRALPIWIKRNIKPIIYSIWFLERVLFLIYMICLIGLCFSIANPAFNNNFNYTDMHIMYTVERLSDGVKVVFLIISIAQEVHFFFAMFVMVLSSFSTVVYLCRHMCHMRANGLPFQHLSSHVRVTVTGMLHGVMFVSWSLWSINQYYNVSMLYFMTYTSWTIGNLYMAGTTVSLGVGQSVFRQRAAALWVTASHWFKARKVQQTGEGEGPKLTPVM